MTKTGVSPRNSVRLRSRATSGASTRPMEVHGKHRHARHPPGTTVGQERADQQHVDRQPGRAAHQRGHQDRRQPVAAVFDDARGHDAGHRAGHRGQQRNERFAAQPAARHQLVHQERRPGHVAAVFQHGDEGEQDHDLRQEHQHAADAFDDAVGKQAASAAPAAGPSQVARKPVLAAAMSSINGLAQVKIDWKTRTSRARKMRACPRRGASARGRGGRST